MDDIARVKALLAGQVGAEVGSVQPLAGGFFSRAFGATAGDRQYVVRLHSDVHAAESFAKDDYAWRHFASPALPIPRVVARGETDAGCFAISERAPGRMLAELSTAEQWTLLPEVLDASKAIGKADVQSSRGFGSWDGAGNGRHTSWRSYLAAIIEDDSDGYYQNWHRLFQESFLERDVFETIYRQMLRLAEFCPEDRALVHTDFQFENIIVAGQRITGVIDWGNAIYGDPLYDVARWIAWSEMPGWWYDDSSALMRSRFGDALHDDERIACYRCHIGLDDLRFYAKNGKRAEYDFFRDRLLALVR